MPIESESTYTMRIYDLITTVADVLRNVRNAHVRPLVGRLHKLRPLYDIRSSRQIMHALYSSRESEFRAWPFFVRVLIRLCIVLAHALSVYDPFRWDIWGSVKIGRRPFALWKHFLERCLEPISFYPRHSEQKLSASPGFSVEQFILFTSFESGFRRSLSWSSGAMLALSISVQS